MASGSDGKLRWRLADDDGPDGQGALFDGDQLVDRHVGTGEFRGMEFLHVNARSIINEVPASSRMPFRYTINAYRGCSHACTYCFARPTHEYLGLDVGQDFERKIVVKVNAVERLRAELAGRRWAGDHIAMGTNTDPYQRCEGKYHLTRGVIDVLAEAANPFSILTKSTLILRDLPRLAAAAQRTDVRASLSIGTLDQEVWQLTEPGTPHPRQRVEAVRRLNDAGVPCGVLIAPILPGLSDRDDQLEEVVQACVDAGAISISSVVLHLRPGVRDHFMGELARTHPHLVAEYERRYRRAYLPAAEQQAVSDKVRRMVERARGSAGPPDLTGHRGFSTAVPTTRSLTTAESPPEDQLTLDLSATS
jgi:DNA repair photolyase